VFEDDSVIAMGDCDDITQVVTNLLDNAIKFAYENTTLGIKIERVGKKVHVSVRNCGPDIPKEEIPFIFEHFYKSDRSRSKDHDGLGLGLYIVRIILNNHKQNISVTSGGGVTDFTFTLDTGINN